jgi:pyrroloquinoline quinone (PQQ) biosynthesis protein C
MTVIIIICIAIVFITLTVLLVYVMVRNYYVCKFRVRLIDLIFDHRDLRHLIEWYERGPSYEEMLYSFKPLHIDIWYKPEFVNELQPSDNTSSTHKINEWIKNLKS